MKQKILIFLFVLVCLAGISYAGLVPGEHSESTGTFSTVTDTQSPTNPASGDSGSSGGDSSVSSNVTVTKPEKNKTKKLTLVPGVGLRNNTKLQTAIEKVFGKGKMNEVAVENLIRLSESIISDLESSRNFKYADGKSTLSLSMTYKGNKTVKNLIIYDKIPKEFANSTDDITVIASKARVQIVEKDPEYAFIYDEIAPNQEISVIYGVSKQVNESVLDDAKLEVYTFSLEESDEEKGITESISSIPYKTIGMLLLILIVAAIFVKTRKPKKQEIGSFYKHK